MKVMRIDNNGFFVEDIILNNGYLIPDDCIETHCQSGFYLPKWDGQKWIEGKTQSEINAIVNVGAELTTEEVLNNLIKKLSDNGVII